MDDAPTPDPDEVRTREEAAAREAAEAAAREAAEAELEHWARRTPSGRLPATPAPLTAPPAQPSRLVAVGALLLVLVAVGAAVGLSHRGEVPEQVVAAPRPVKPAKPRPVFTLEPAPSGAGSKTPEVPPAQPAPREVPARSEPSTPAPQAAPAAAPRTATVPAAGVDRSTSSSAPPSLPAPEPPPRAPETEREPTTPAPPAAERPLTAAERRAAERAAAKRDAEVKKRTAQVEAALRPIVERWYVDREVETFPSGHPHDECPTCFAGESIPAIRRAWTDLLSPDGRKRAGDPGPFYIRLKQGKVMASQRGVYEHVRRGRFLGARLEDRVIVARSHVIWYTAEAEETEHESRWILRGGRFYLAFEDEQGERLLPE
jgi:hypothetical protein